jgi:hypothetical protein
MPSKPIPIEIKLFALEDFGYTYNWKCIRSDLAEGALIEKK